MGRMLHVSETADDRGPGAYVSSHRLSLVFVVANDRRFLPRAATPARRHGFRSECVELWPSSQFPCHLCRVGVDYERPAGAPSPGLGSPSGGRRNSWNRRTIYPPIHHPFRSTNVLFRGSQGAVTETTVARAAVDVGGRTSSSSAGTYSRGAGHRGP
ncbi:hypothetical protein GUJ93_ZPchr0014g46882 [Zizania palustris]|uniref:Uncharacterized protein n=1 Tax=Zizania palustris TaxID=103762 RepID=A0A8J5VRU5_ZIZPA|nr:hypothetical protein GUJ93_ZPchr0014g46882 [Zizania palustris]